MAILNQLSKEIIHYLKLEINLYNKKSDGQYEKHIFVSSFVSLKFQLEINFGYNQ